MEPQDKTRVVKNKVIPFRISKEQLNKIINQRLLNNLSIIYDNNKAKKYENMLNFYNNNFFGYGMFGRLTNYNPVTELNKIQSNFNYGRDNVINLATTLVTSGIGGLFKGVLTPVGKRVTIGKLAELEPYTIGSGAESVVIKNSPFNVAKISQIGRNEIMLRNNIPNALTSKFMGYVRNGSKRLPTYLLKKVKMATEKTFPKYLNKIDKVFKLKGFRKIEDPYIPNGAYTDGKIVVDDIKPENIGVTLFGKPKLIDFNVTPVNEWVDLGYSL